MGELAAINRPNFYFKETTYPSSRQQGLTVNVSVT
jgi:hypothetical protein